MKRQPSILELLEDEIESIHAQLAVLDAKRERLEIAISVLRELDEPQLPESEPQRVAAQTPPAPRQKNAKRRVAECYREHPDWSVGQMSRHLGIPKGTVSVYRVDARKDAEEAARSAAPPPSEPETGKDGSYIRNAIRKLHATDGDVLDSYAAATRLGLSFSSLRSFSHELGLTWGEAADKEPERA